MFIYHILEQFHFSFILYLHIGLIRVLYFYMLDTLQITCGLRPTVNTL